MNKKLILQSKIIEGNVVPVSDTAKDRIRKFIDSSDMATILTLSNMSKPTVHIINSDPQKCNDRLKEISGWEMCEAAILNCLSALNDSKGMPIQEDFETNTNEL